ncbi:MAG: hypothetical protein JNJ48_04655 [Phycisphaerae bacterium]|nr:hypothetical protein [Phycisphaerae bacterium]
MSAADSTKTLNALIGRLRNKQAPGAAAGPAFAGTESGVACCCEGDAVLREFVRSFLHWETTATRAENALRRIDQAVVDINEFRVCMPDEMAQIIGPNYPRVEERCERLRAALFDLYKREHKVAMSHLAEKPKRAAREYLEGLGGVPQFVAARVTLLSLGGHAFPLDTRMHGRLLEEGVLDPTMAPADAAGWLERSVRAGEAAEAYTLIQAWCDSAEKAGAARGKRTAVKKTVAPKRRSRGE